MAHMPIQSLPKASARDTVPMVKKQKQVVRVHALALVEVDAGIDAGALALVVAVGVAEGDARHGLSRPCGFDGRRGREKTMSL
jgi:hypothetical protein